MVADPLPPTNGKVIDSKEEQPKKAPSPIEVTQSGITIEIKDVQSEKAYLPIDVTLSGITIDVKDEQLEKAQYQTVRSEIGTVLNE